MLSECYFCQIIAQACGYDIDGFNSALMGKKNEKKKDNKKGKSDKNDKKDETQNESDDSDTGAGRSFFVVQFILLFGLGCVIWLDLNPLPRHKSLVILVSGAHRLPANARSIYRVSTNAESLITPCNVWINCHIP